MDPFWKEHLHEKLEQLNTSVEELFKEPFAWTEITVFLKAAIMVAEDFYPYPDTGVSKRELVMEIWYYYDTEYHLIVRLDEMVDLRKLLGKVVGTILEPFDETVMRAVIEQIIIPIIVSDVFPKFAKVGRTL